MKRTLLVILCFWGMHLVAQTAEIVELKNKMLLEEVGLSGAIGSNFFAPSLFYQHSWRLGAKQRWDLTYGARVTSYFGSDIHHASAPPAYYGDPTLEDSVFVVSPRMSNVAIYVGATYSIKNKVPIGFNIDAIGYTFGGDLEGIYTGDGISTPVTVNPGSITALLVGPNDIGMLKAEFFVGYRINNNFTVRAGINNMYTEVRTPTELQVGNTRYRAENMGGLISLVYMIRPLISR